LFIPILKSIIRNYVLILLILLIWSPVYAALQARLGTLNFHKRLQHPEIEAKIDHPEDDIAILDAIWRNVEGDREEGSSGINVINAETPSEFWKQS